MTKAGVRAEVDKIDGVSADRASAKVSSSAFRWRSALIFATSSFDGRRDPIDELPLQWPRQLPEKMPPHEQGLEVTTVSYSSSS